ncbi:Fe-S cluster assembly sulfur transfer protein SufU [Woeseia oceani]|uniref:SUF system NifU family Fe-S cluster assembly protein n=1 Tax=Woeseia oceani TaxID=1548547 RepID=A0A193LGU9_9GAMM|nr:SUF system NifU family Fe-S cluster assembly protein [Woeseia oceani]ANO51589.1 SUF system NifU family Fe-S cluster assembly protein [Woeseia oceani]
MTSDSSELRDLYRELILDHARNPRHFGELPNATHQADGVNPLCGDKLHLYMEILDDGIIGNAAFNGTGCAISMASASLLTDTVVGLDKNTALAYFATLVSRLTGDGKQSTDATIDLGKLRALEGVRDYPSRVKCATLAWHALHSALNSETQTVTTE